MDANIEKLLNILEQNKRKLKDAEYKEAIETLSKISDDQPPPRQTYELNIMRVTSKIGQNVDISSVKDYTITPRLEFVKLHIDLNKQIYVRIAEHLKNTESAIYELSRDDESHSEWRRSGAKQFNKFLRDLAPGPFVTNEPVACEVCGDDSETGGQVTLWIETKVYVTGIFEVDTVD